LDVGFEIETLQRGGQPRDFKPMPTVGVGVEEIRVRSGLGACRVIYTARLADKIVVLHAFQKKSRGTSRMDLQIAKTRFNQLKRSPP
jgi:phage-related protein